MTIEIGATIPDLSLVDQNNQVHRLTDYKGKPIVVFFYPKDDTPVCTIEACTFRDNFSEFEELEATVFGISADSPESHQKFANKYNLNFSLLSDTDRKAEKAFGIERNLFGLLAQRVTFIFDANGVLTHKFKSQFNGKKHIKEALKAIRASQ